MGVIISTVIVGLLTYGVVVLIGIDFSLMGCFVFGALISCTDPIAITKSIRRYSLSSALETKVEGEALLNGGIAIVLAFTLSNVYKLQNSMELVESVDILMVVGRDILGGLMLGAGMGGLGYILLEVIDNDVVEAEMLVTMALVMTGSYIADYLGVSSMLSAVLSGLIIGNFGRNQTTGESAVGVYVYKFWLLIEETVAAILFVLIGFEMLVIPIRLDYFAAGFFAVSIVLFARWLSMFLPIRMMSFFHDFDKATVSVLTWGGLRGGLSVAFTLSLTEFEGRDIIITLTYIVVICSLLYQGLTLGKVMEVYKDKNANRLDSD
jgi:CPA1 family monovalent cation:H+ antiporter